MAAFEVIALDTATPQLRAPGASDTYTFPRAVEMPLGTANGVLYLNGSKVVSSGSALTFDGTRLTVNSGATSEALRLNSTADTYLQFQRSGVGTAYIQSAAGAMYLWNQENTATLFGVNNTEQMRLTSTGLGIGTSSPGAKLQVLATGKATIFGSATAQNSYSAWQYNGADVGYIGNAAGVVGAAGATDFGITAFTGGKLWLGANNGTGTTYAVLDTSGNLGLGVTPSAWSGLKAFEFAGVGSSLASAANNNVFLSANAWYNGTNWSYGITGAATQYQSFNGAHSWYTAPSGTAGNAISFTQALTLDAGGRLLIGQTVDKTQEVVRIAGSGQASLLLDNAGKTNGAFVGVFNDAALFGVNRNPSTGVFYNTSNYAAEITAVGSSSTSYIAFGTATAANTAPTERARIKSTGQLRYIPLAADPAGAENGDVYYNSGTNKLRLYAAGAWVDLN